MTCTYVCMLLVCQLVSQLSYSLFQVSHFLGAGSSWTSDRKSRSLSVMRLWIVGRLRSIFPAQAHEYGLKRGSSLQSGECGSVAASRSGLELQQPALKPAARAVEGRIYYWAFQGSRYLRVPSKGPAYGSTEARKLRPADSSGLPVSLRTRK